MTLNSLSSLTDPPTVASASVENASVELGTTTLDLETASQLAEGSRVRLDQTTDDPVDLFVAGRLVARAELLVIDDEFALRIVEVI